MIVIALTSPAPPPSSDRRRGGGGCLEAESGDPNLQDPDLLIHIPVDSRLRSQSLPGYNLEAHPFPGHPHPFHPFIQPPPLLPLSHFYFHSSHPTPSPFIQSLPL